MPVHIRAHHLLGTGDGTAALKWGSTNAYTEDAAGKPVYDWTIVDRIFDTYRHAKAKPFVEIGFMPEALSVKPEPYATKWKQSRRRHRLGLSAQGLPEVGRADLPVGAAPGGTLRQRRSEHMALGVVE